MGSSPVSFRDTYTQTQAALHTDATAEGAPHESAAGAEKERTPTATEGESPDRTLSHLSSEYTGAGEGNSRAVMNASGSIRQEPADYQPQEGEALLHEPSSQELEMPRMRLQHAIDPSQTPDPDAEGSQADPSKKFGFPKSHFDHAFHNPGQNSSSHTVTVGGGEEVSLPNDHQTSETSVGRLANMMPSRLTQDGHLERLSTQEDPAHEGSGPSDQVSGQKFFESAAALKHAQQQGYDPSTVQRHSAKIDFRANTPDGGEAHFDPFDSPQYGQLSDKTKAMQQALQEHERPGGTKLSANAKKHFEKQVKSETASKAKEEAGYKLTNRFKNDAYKKHTDNSKADGSGTPVTGVWNQTFTKADQLQHEQAATDGVGNMNPVDLNLPHEFAREDALARQQIEHRKANAGSKGESES